MGERTIQDLYQLQGLPLNLKIRMTKDRIRQWIQTYGEDGVYVSFSGGKDSTVLLHLVREEYSNIPGMFIDTGLEYPEIRQFVRTFDNIDWVKPKMGFKAVIQKYGYPFISKEVAECVYGARKYLTSVLESEMLDRPTLMTTGCNRTGCMFCGFGCHLEKPGNGRFERMKITHPKQYDYIMRPWEEGGLNYKEVIDWINEHGNMSIKY